MEISWARRAAPLEPAAVLARDTAVATLARAALDRITGGARLTVHAGDGFLLVVGATADLPWSDGVIWLGRDGELLVPTTQLTDPDTALVWRAIARRIGNEADWIVLLPDRILAGERAVGDVDLDRLRALAGPGQVG